MLTPDSPPREPVPNGQAEQTHREDEDEDYAAVDPLGRDAPRLANPEVRASNGGGLPNTKSGVSAFDLDAFALNPLQCEIFVPKRLMRKYAKVVGLLLHDLNEAIESTGPDRDARIGEAARWYCGLPQIFLRKSNHGSG